MEANLKRRFHAALVIIPFVVLIVGWGRPWQFASLVMLVTLLALYEYFAMVLPGYHGQQAFGMIFGLTVWLLAAIPDLADFDLWISLLLALSFAGYVFVPGKLPEKFTRLAWTLLGGFYIGLLMPNWIFLFRFPDGRRWVFFVVGVIVAGDTLAYFLGKHFGVKKLAPELSPAKTVVGAWGYVLGSCIVGAIMGIFVLAEYPLLEIILLTLVFAALGQIGDLFESMLKRAFTVKDSGSLIPGHGGILDRLDSLIFPVVFANFYLRVFHS